MGSEACAHPVELFLLLNEYSFTSTSRGLPVKGEKKRKKDKGGREILKLREPMHLGGENSFGGARSLSQGYF